MNELNKKTKKQTKRTPFDKIMKALLEVPTKEKNKQKRKKSKKKKK